MNCRSLFLYCLTIVYTSMFFSCAGSSTGKNVKPVWVTTLPYKTDYIEQVGYAAASRNPEVSRRRAEEDAKRKLAEYIEVQVSSLVRDYVTENNDYFTDDGSSVVFYEQVSASVTDASLSGIQYIERWKNPKTGEEWVLAGIPLNETKEKMKQTAGKEVERRKKAGYLKKLRDEAMEELDRRIQRFNPEY